jgi:hypothetical protein
MEPAYQPERSELDLHGANRASCTVTIHEHLDEAFSIRYGPHVIGQFEANGQRCGKVHSPPKSRPSPFPSDDGDGLPLKPKRQAARAA